MSVEKVAARVHRRERAVSPDPLVMYDLGRVDGTDVTLPPAPPATASTDARAVAAIAMTAGLPVAKVAAMTATELAALVADHAVS